MSKKGILSPQSLLSISMGSKRGGKTDFVRTCKYDRRETENGPHFNKKMVRKTEKSGHKYRNRTILLEKRRLIILKMKMK
jgi:hypothetical protein